jgi:hypothetical protein
MSSASTGCSRLGVSGLAGSHADANGLYIQSSITLLVSTGFSCGTTPVYVQHGSSASRAVIISNRNVAIDPNEPVYWVVLDDASRLVGLSITDVMLAISSGSMVSGIIAVLVDDSDARDSFSTQGPIQLTDSSGKVTLECGLCVVFLRRFSFQAVCQPGSLSSLGCRLDGTNLYCSRANISLLPCDIPFSATNMLVD